MQLLARLCRITLNYSDSISLELMNSTGDTAKDLHSSLNLLSVLRFVLLLLLLLSLFFFFFFFSAFLVHLEEKSRVPVSWPKNIRDVTGCSRIRHLPDGVILQL